ncbi:MAG: PIN domain-containing protein [Candidatus Woesearchaeota archaeon]
MEEHKAELMQKSGMKPEEFEELLQLLLKKVRVVPEKTLKTYKEQALDAVKNIDPDDAVFIACALAYPESVVWSDDKKLKKQEKIKILNTAEIKAYLEKA